MEHLATTRSLLRQDRRPATDRVEDALPDAHPRGVLAEHAHQRLQRELGRQLAIARRQVDGVCRVCGQAFTGTTKRRYCSNRCAVRAYRQRQEISKGFSRV